MTQRSVAQKMGIKPGWRTFVLGAPDGIMESLGVPALDIQEELLGEFQYLHLFVCTQAQMRKYFPDLIPHLGAHGKLWLSWPKGRQLGSDLTLSKVIEIGYGFGLVESTCLRVNDTWSALRFTHPKKGKVYQNSFGTLTAQRPSPRQRTHEGKGD